MVNKWHAKDSIIDQNLTTLNNPASVAPPETPTRTQEKQKRKKNFWKNKENA